MEETKVNKTLRNWAFCLAVLALSISALAANKNGYTTSKDGKTTYAVKASGYIGGANLPSGLQVISSNLNAFYPLGRYFCCYGNTISSAGSIIGHQYAVGVPFTPAANATIKKIVVAVGYVTGTNSAQVSINADNGGLPGAPIIHADINNLPPYGSCCVLDLHNANLPVTQGTQYWVVVSTDSNSPDTWDGWNFNTTNMTILPYAGQADGIWGEAIGELPAYGVFGTTP